jgi:hypothetical protein
MGSIGAAWAPIGRVGRYRQYRHRPDTQRTPYCTNNSEVRDIIATDMVTESARSTNLAVDQDFVDPSGRPLALVSKASG